MSFVNRCAVTGDWARTVFRWPPGPTSTLDANASCRTTRRFRPASAGTMSVVTPTRMRGEHVILEPLDLSHVDGLFAATADPEVWRYMLRTQPATPEELAGQVRQALHAHHLGTRVPWVQRNAATGSGV